MKTMQETHPSGDKKEKKMTVTVYEKKSLNLND